MSDRTSQIIGRLSRINAYVVVVAFFLFITFIVGDSNLYKRYTYDEKIRSLEREIDLYDKEIEMNTIKLNDIRVNREGLERYAREEFFMKRPNEDVITHMDLHALRPARRGWGCALHHALDVCAVALCHRCGRRDGELPDGTY